jgi:UDP-N-acetylglucosamine:LPS N-acetylglucosamine transferase
MKICIVASEGGHMTEALLLKDAFGDFPFFLVSYRCTRTEGWMGEKVLLPIFPERLRRLPLAVIILWKAFRAKRPTVVISTGSEIAIPAFVMAKLLGIPTVFIETVTRFENATWTGRILYPISDKFFVQNRESLSAYGPRAEYHGPVI